MPIDCTKFVILDRDGVINHDSVDYIKTAEEWIPVDGSLQAIAELSGADFTVVVATNQSGIGRGLLDEQDLVRIHQKMLSLVQEHGGFIKRIFHCPHLPGDGCECRKPRVGLLKQIEAEFGCHVRNAPLVGDSLKDMQAAKAMGCLPILVRTGKGNDTLRESSSTDMQGVTVVNTLAEAAAMIIERDRA
ncbi:MAG: D-glycero-beta-D-manno-heptose 1,7-bisphosphate 7-phosphatase [Pseudohongiellaceae bacterium]